MPNQGAIANPAGAYGLPLSGTTIGGATVMTNDILVVEMVNQSGSTLLYGDVVVYGTGATPTYDASGLNAGLTPTAADLMVAGVVSQIGNQATGVPAGFNMLVVVGGVARVNVVNTTAVTVGLGLVTTSVVKQATGVSAAITIANLPSIFAVALEAFAAHDTRSDAATTVRAKIGMI